MCYEVKTEDIYQDMYDNREHFDLSDMRIEKFKDDTNKKVIGKFKDETKRKPIRQLIRLRSKMYCNKLDNDEEKKLQRYS